MDFLVRIRAPGGGSHSIILEYDGFKEHFVDLEEVHAYNYEHYYRPEDVEREKILEGYGYKILRVNRFNLGRDPVATLSDRLFRLTQDLFRGHAAHEFVEDVRDTAEGLASGEMRQCSRCAEVKPLNSFRDPALKRGYGRICSKCKSAKSVRANTAQGAPRRRYRGRAAG